MSENIPDTRLEWRKPTYRVIEERGLSIERCRELFDLDYETGELRWKISLTNRVRVGDKAGSKAVGGYLNVQIEGLMYRVHRIIFSMANDRWPWDQVDHKNGITPDNRPDNLRDATHEQNVRNGAKRKNNTSDVSGVTWYTHSQKWVARIGTDKHRKYLGCFTDRDEAKLAVDLARLQHHGIFARLNDPNGPYMAMFEYAADLQPMSRLETPILRRLV